MLVLFSFKWECTSTIISADYFIFSSPILLLLTNITFYLHLYLVHVSFLFLRPMILKINDIHAFCSLSLYCQHTQNQILKASIETQHPNNIPDLLDSFYQLVLGHRFVKKHVHKSNPERGRRSVPGLPFLLFPCYI